MKINNRQAESKEHQQILPHIDMMLSEMPVEINSPNPILRKTLIDLFHILRYRISMRIDACIKCINICMFYAHWTKLKVL